MPVPTVEPADPWLRHSGGIYEPEQTDPISIKFAGPVQGVSLQSTGAVKCSGSSIGRMIGYREGIKVDSGGNSLIDPSDCGEDDLTFGVAGALNPNVVIDSLIIEGVDPWTFTVSGLSGRARLDYMVMFVPAPQVIVDADAAEVVVGDSVTFNALTLGNESLVLVGWRWKPEVDTLWDPWTHACSGTATTCTIQLHGSGRMLFTAVRQSGDSLKDSVTLVANLPPDVSLDGEGFGDVDSAATSTSSATLTSISSSLSDSVLSAAVQQGEWHYTQGCYQCGSQPWPNSEPPKDLPNKYGDCTDFVWTVVKSAVPGWNYAYTTIASFGQMSNDAKASRRGYVLTTFDSVRSGDVVVRVTVDGTGNLGSGHAGIFWIKGRAGHPIGIANNGLPAKPSRANKDTVTGPYDFYEKPGFRTLYFRPATP